MLPSSPGTLVAGLLARSRVMPQSPLPRRVRILEEKVQQLERLPARIDNLEVQILQFREEVRGEFSATREGMGSLRAEMLQLHEQALARIALTEAALLHEMNQLDERGAAGIQETRRQLAETRTELIARIAEGDEETRRYMRVLHEEVIARIATIGERGRPRE
jgi:hypothetical protein